MPRTDIKPNFQDLLKFLAIISMLIDHISLYFLDLQFFPIIDPMKLRLIGRFAMPIFLFFAGYNYFSSKKKYNINFCFRNIKFRRIFLLAIILQILSFVILKEYHLLNILFTIIFGFIIIDFCEYMKISNYIIIILSFFTWPFAADLVDYSTIGIAFVICGFLFNKEKNQSVIFALATLFALNAFMNQIIFYFSFTQTSILYFMMLCSFLSLTYIDLKTELNFKPLLISRYALEIYVVHIILFMLLTRYFYAPLFI